MTGPNDVVNASVAAALVQSGLSFQSTVGTTGEGTIVRIFLVTFDLPNGLGQSTITGYFGGFFFVALTPLRIESESKAREVFQAVVPSSPLVRMWSDLQAGGTDPAVVWVEASVPMPESGPIDPSLAAAPFHAVAAAVAKVRTTFPEHTAVTAMSRLPMLKSEVAAPGQ